MDYCFDYPTLAELEKKIVDASKEMIQKQLDYYAESNSVEIIVDIIKGIPYKEILTEEQKQHIDLIVIGAHGKSDSTKYLLGSVAEGVLREAKCPVLVVRM